MLLFAVMASCLWSPATVSAGEPFVVSKLEVSGDEIVERLMISAYTYKFTTAAENPPTRYFVQFEHWRMGELQQTQRTKRFALEPQDEEPSVFIAFPSFPQKHVLVSPSGGDGEFRGNLEFDLPDRQDWASSSLHLEEACITGLKPGMSVLLGFSVLGVAQWIEWEELEKLEKDENDPLSPELNLYHQRLMERKRDDVDVVVFRLVFE